MNASGALGLGLRAGFFEKLFVLALPSLFGGRLASSSSLSTEGRSGSSVGEEGVFESRSSAAVVDQRC